MSLKESLLNKIKDMEVLAKALEVKPFEMFFLGGSGCIMADYFSRVTLDYDFIDLGYSANIGRVLNVLGDFDMLDSKLTPVSLTDNMRKRCKKLNEFQYLGIYILSREDVIVSKLSRFNEKDREDINKLMNGISVKVLNQVAQEVLDRNDLYSNIKNRVEINFKTLKRVYNV